MKIEIKKSTKLIEYKKAIDLLEKRLIDVNKNKLSELIWILEHPNTYTAGTGFDVFFISIFIKELYYMNYVLIVLY